MMQIILKPFNAVSWYLSLMLCFALLTPLAVKIWDYLSIKMTIILSLITVLFEFILIIFGTDLSFIHWLAYVFQAVRLLDFIIRGYWKLSKYIKENGLFGINKFLFWISCVILTACMVVSCYIGNNYFLTALWTLPATMLVTSVYNTKLKDGFIDSLVGKTLIMFGNISFEFFLIHQLCIRYLSIVCRRLSLPYVCAYAIAFVLSLIVASFMYSTNNKRKMKFE